MQNEIIDLPEKLEDIHLLLLRYREELITSKLAKERLEEKLKSETQIKIISQKMFEKSLSVQTDHRVSNTVIAVMHV